MKKAAFLLMAVACLSLTACVATNPVPKFRMEGAVAGQKFAIENPKDTTVTNMVFEVETNGTARLKIGYLSSANSSNVIATSYNGQADVVKATMDGTVKLMDAMANMGGKAAAAAVKP